MDINKVVWWRAHKYGFKSMINYDILMDMWDNEENSSLFLVFDEIGVYNSHKEDLRYININYLRSHGPSEDLGPYTYCISLHLTVYCDIFGDKFINLIESLISDKENVQNFIMAVSMIENFKKDG